MKLNKKIIKTMMGTTIKCCVDNCNKPATVFYKNGGFCKEHGNDYQNIEKYVEVFKKKRTEKWKKRNQMRGKSSDAQNVAQTKTDIHTHSEHIKST